MNKFRELFSKGDTSGDNSMYASPLKRMASFLVDVIIIATIFSATIKVANYFGFNTAIYKENIVVENQGTEDESLNVEETVDVKAYRNTYYMLLLLSTAYFVSFLSSKKQATLGNQMFKIMVVHTKNARVSPLSAFMRYIATILNNMLYGVGYLLYFFRGDHAVLQDILSDTRVINLKK